MSTLFKRLLENVVIAALFSIAIGAFTLSQYKQYINEQNELHKQQLAQMLPQLTTLLKNKKNDTFITSGTYKNLTIFNLQHEALYLFEHPNQGQLATWLSISPHKLAVEPLDITIEYNVNVNNLDLLLISFFYAIIVLSLAIGVILAVLRQRKWHTNIAQINKTIENQFNYFEQHKKCDTQSAALKLLPAINNGLTQMSTIFAHQNTSSNELEQSAFIDPVTQLNNRSRFVQYFEKQTEQTNEASFGVLLITRCSELQSINQIHGFSEGDNYVVKIATIMKNAIVRYKNAELFRLNSSEFAAVLPNIALTDAEGFADELTAKFNEYQLASDLDSVAYSGLAVYQKDKPLGELLAIVDTGISIAQTQHTNSWYAQKNSDILSSSSASYGNQNWRQEIDSVIENQRISLHVQQIKPSNRNAKMYGEILARFMNSSDEVLPTSSFFAMAEKLDKIVAIDRLIIEKTIEEITNKNLVDNSFGINVSARSIHEEHFLIWLERRLLRDSNIASKLVFEISEYGLQQNIKTAKRFIDMLHRAGARVTVERFGVGLTSFKFFRELKPDYIKMDSTYTRDIDEDKNNQYFLRLMIDLAHRLNISVLAEAVETQQEKFTLDKLFIDGCQGFYIGKPTAI